MLHDVLQYGLAGFALVFALCAWLVRGKRAVFVWAALAALSAAGAAHAEIFWATVVFALISIWGLFCAFNMLDLAWRVKTGFVLFLAVGAGIAIYPTYHDERYGKFAPSADLPSDEQAEIELKAKRGEMGVSDWLLTNVPFRLVRGLDLKGGLRLVYTVEVDKAIEDKRDRYYDEIRQSLAVAYGFGTKEKAPTVEDLAKLPTKVKVDKSRAEAGVITLTFNDAADSTVVNDEFLRKYLQELQVQRSSDKKKITFRINSAAESKIRESAVSQAKETVRRRVDELGVKEAQLSSRDEDIIIEVAGDDEKAFARMRETVSETARLEFKMVDDGVDYFAQIAKTAKEADLPKGMKFEIENAPFGPGRTKPVYFARLIKLQKEDLAGALKRFKEWTSTLQIDPDHEIGFGKVQEPNPDTEEMEDVGWRSYYLFSRAEVTGDMVHNAEHQSQQNSDRGLPGWVVTMELSPAGADRFEDVTGKNIMKRFAIILDSKVESAPRILSKIGGGHCQITMGSGNPEQQRIDAEHLATVIKSGSLPAPISPSNEQRIGPSLGQDALMLGLKGGASGGVLVFVFMLVYYSRAGMIANVAVMFNLVLQIAILALLGASMTLPGIAGLVLTIGIAVDANVLINERIREELRNGKTPRAAVDVGYEKAFSAIIDGHATTAISSIILWQYGSGPIKGFAVTLFFGILVSLFTGVVCTRLMFDWAVRARKVKKLYLG